jgi:hypothetical protein
MVAVVESEVKVLVVLNVSAEGEDSRRSLSRRRAVENVGRAELSVKF